MTKATRTKCKGSQISRFSLLALLLPHIFGPPALQKRVLGVEWGVGRHS